MVVFLSGNQTSIVCGQESGCPHCPGSWGASWATVSRTVETTGSSGLIYYHRIWYNGTYSVLFTLHWSLRNEIESPLYMASYRVSKNNFVKDCIDKCEYIKQDYVTY